MDPQPSLSRFWKLRELLATLAAIAVIVAVIYYSWSGEADEERAVASTAVKNTLELKTFDLQAKLLLGVQGYSERSGVTEPSSYSPVIDTLIASSPDAEAPKSAQQAFLLRQAVLAHFVAKPTLAEQRVKLAKELEPSPEADELGQMIATGRIGEPSPALKRSLGWTAGLLSRSRPEVLSEAMSVTMKVSILGIIGLLLGITGVVTLLAMFFVVATGRAKFRFSSGTLRPALRIESFLLYILGMSGIGLFLHYVPISSGTGRLLANVGVMAVLFVCALSWPVINGQTWSDTKAAFGLKIESVRKLIGDLALAPFFYVAMWVVLLPALLVYTLVLKVLGLDITKGSHPVFNWLAGDSDPATYWLIILIAVVIAPVLEEVTFRGALYSWLRLRFGALLSILVSSFVFAAIHPQGPLGVVPLMACGIAFSLIREWRGSLYPSMVAHACFNGGSLLLFSLVTGMS